MLEIINNINIIGAAIRGLCYEQKTEINWKGEVKTNIFFNSARFFVSNCPHFQAIMYTMNFNKVTVIKIFKLNC